MIGKIFKQKIILAILVGSFFLIAELITMSDYNMMWDARNHFFRGQAFANFFLYGKKNYNNLPVTKDMIRYYKDYKKQEIPKDRLSKDINYRRSIYQDEVGTFEWLMKIKATGHPVLSDIGSAFSNILFYEKLGIIRDDYAYALFSIVFAAVLVGVFFYWIFSFYGFFPAVVAAFVLATTPLFWAESHYNIKDIPLLVFFSLAIFAFWQGVRKYSLKWIAFSSVAAGFALGTKFNALFLPVIIFSWGFIYLFTYEKTTRNKYLNWWWVLFVYPLTMFLILVIGWPQLWENPIGGFINVINYYKEVGVNIDYTPAFRTVFNFSTYPALWILYTTYPVVILLTVVGFLGWILKFKKSKDSLPLLFIIWFLILLIRASLPNTSIFGGVRHIIEYIPPLSFFAGYGVYVLFNIVKFRLKIVVFLLIFISFIPFVITLIRLHPAENVYFNSLIGGLQGAKKANITGWGNTDGGIYEQAVVWLNKNAEKNSHIAVGFSEPADFYIPSLREDLIADNQFSGFLQKGEYIVALTHNSELEHTYRMLYPESSLIPVYDYKADGVSLIKIWKNEKKYLKKDIYNLKDEVVEISPSKQDNFLQWDLEKEANVNFVEFSFDKNALCKNLSLAYFQVSSDQQVWKILPETYPGGPIDALGNQPVGNKLIAPFVNIRARYIRLISDSDDACILNAKKTKFHLLK